MTDPEQWIDCRIIGRSNGDGTTSVEFYVVDMNEPVANFDWASDLSKLQNGYIGIANRGGQINVVSTHHLDSFKFTEFRR